MTSKSAGTWMPAKSGAREEAEWWKTVLGEYPTGVALITSKTEDGEDFGLVVGTFMAVSENPPLIGFMPSVESRRALKVKQNGTFCVNVLGYDHEQLCRAFAMGDPDCFQYGEWDRSPLDNARLTDSLCWFEGTITQAVPAGDHEIIIAAVSDLGVGDGRSGLPLLFLKGGYGSFSVPNEQFNVQAFALRMRVADAIREIVQQVGDETGTECMLATIVHDSVIVLSAANLLPHRPADGIVGMMFPFAAPMAPALAAWNTPERQKAWTENSRHLLGKVDRKLLAKQLETVRQQGYAVSASEHMGLEFDRITDDPNSTRADYSKLWASTAQDIERTLDAGTSRPDVFSLQFPVFNTSGHAEFELVISGIQPGTTQQQLLFMVDRVRAAAERLTELVGERFPGTPA